MGGHPYWYFVDYERDANSALQKLRHREFKAGRYNPVIRYLAFPITEKSQSPGAKHATIDDALSAAQEEGTRSILDIQECGDSPDFCIATPLDEEKLNDLFGTAHPTREMIENSMELWEDIERGEAIYITVYKDEEPNELFFAGVSFD